MAPLTVGPFQFEAPMWLLLIPVLGALTAWMGRRSLSGLGPITRWVALAARIIVITLVAGAIAEPSWRKQAKDVAVNVVLDSSESIPTSTQRQVESYVEKAVTTTRKAPSDRLGVLTAAKDAYVQSLPSARNVVVEKQHIGAPDGTNLAGAIRLAMAVMPQDAANRIVLASDGNETAGSVLQAAEAARAAGVPIDVLPVRYEYSGEVLVDRLVAPATARRGENIPLRVVIQATRSARGRLGVLLNGEPVDLDPSSTSLSAPVELKPGPNVLTVPVTVATSGPQRFEAVFEPDILNGKSVGDEIAQNNRAEAVTFVSGEGKVLVLRSDDRESERLVAALRESRMDVTLATAEQLPGTLTELSGYDALVMVNQPADLYSLKQQQDLRQYVHDVGGGLVMVGGPRSFGAGGWIGSPLEDALPIRMDPPQKRQMPRGALALVIHSVELPEGVYLGKRVCEAAANALSRKDFIGINEFSWNGGVDWVYPLTEVGDGTAAKRAIERLTFGDMQDFAPSLELTLAGLLAVNAGQKHVVIISDGDPQPPSQQLLQKFVKAGITISAVGIACHGPGGEKAMKYITDATKGRFYSVDARDAAKVPQIFIKEAQTVKRSLIWEGDPFVPAVSPVSSEAMRGINTVPPLQGYVVGADREGLAIVSLRGKENDPILAQWQFGLGRAITYTSDASPRWNNAWIGWGQYRAFWEQHVRWAMRPAGSANVRVSTETRGSETVVTVDAFDASGERMNFASFVGRVARPDGEGDDVVMRQFGPGRYEARVPTEQAGAYVMNLIYTVPTVRSDGTVSVSRGTVQAAAVRPFADEFRTLQDNAPLLKQVAAMTGGRVLSGDAVKDDLWTRDGVRFPVSTRQIWLHVAIAAVAFFLTDVAVRRVRIDVVGGARWVMRVLSPARQRASKPLENLQAARAKAKKKIAARASEDGVDAVRAAAAVKFEAPRGAKAGPIAEPPPGAPRVGPGAPPPAGPQAPAKPGAEKKADPSEGMSRLIRAKKKALEEMDE